MASTRPKAVTRKTGINVLPIVIYIVVALVVTAGMFAWDVRYRRAEEDRRKPPAPETIARNLVENVIGANTVREVKVDKDSPWPRAAGRSYPSAGARRVVHPWSPSSQLSHPRARCAAKVSTRASSSIGVTLRS